MEAYEHRVINGILKSGLAANTPEQVEALLARDFELVIDPHRCEELWPCIWALASVLEREFSGTIYLNCGYGESLAAPANLGSRVVFNHPASPSAITVAIGVEIRDRAELITGDVRGTQVSFGRVIHNEQKAHPVASFALAGYLGYAALARSVGLDPYHEHFVKHSLNLSPATALPTQVPDSLVLLGLGQLGQAYLALLFFLDVHKTCSIQLLDRDAFEIANRTTQILLDETATWEGESKANYLASRFVDLGWSAAGDTTAIDWGWKRSKSHATLVVVGVDNFDTRRMATSAEFDWVFEAGVGTSFVQPKITWHSFPGRPEFSKIFPSDPVAVAPQEPETAFGKALRNNTPGGCGWVRFNNIAASAPSLGLVASAFLWSEILQHASGGREEVGGLARLWSPLLPYTRESLQISSDESSNCITKSGSEPNPHSLSHFS